MSERGGDRGGDRLRGSQLRQKRWKLEANVGFILGHYARLAFYEVYYLWYKIIGVSLAIGRQPSSYNLLDDVSSESEVEDAELTALLHQKVILVSGVILPDNQSLCPRHTIFISIPLLLHMYV